MDYATTLNIDQQGRIIIPAKVRKALQLHTGDVLMLEADTRNICLRKCDSHIPMDIRLDSFLDILHSNVPCRILLCNHSKIIASKNYHTAVSYTHLDVYKRQGEPYRTAPCERTP